MRLVVRCLFVIAMLVTGLAGMIGRFHSGLTTEDRVAKHAMIALSLTAGVVSESMQPRTIAVWTRVS